MPEGPSPPSAHSPQSPALTVGRTWTALAAVGILLAGLVAALEAPARYSTWNVGPGASSGAGWRTAFSGGGHANLRAPWVAPPTPPALAPDGLPYGAIGTTGARTPVGPGSFTPGSAHTIGTAPCSTSGCTTTIAGPTYWGNQTYSLLGNVTVPLGVALTVDDSTLTFTETATTLGYAYGFNVSGQLLVRSGSLVQQTSTTTNSLYVWSNCNSNAPLVVFQNATIRATSSHVVKTAACAGINDPIHQKLFLGVGWFNFSAFYGSTYTAGLGAPYAFAAGPTSNLKLDGGAVRSFFSAGAVLLWSTWRDDVFDNALAQVIGWASAQDPIVIASLTFQNLTTGSVPVTATSVMGSQVQSLTITGDRFFHDNLTAPASAQSFVASYGRGAYVAMNDSWTNCWTWGSSFTLLGDEPAYNVTVEHLTIVNYTILGNAANEGHGTIISGTGSVLGSPGILAGQVSSQTLLFEFNVVNGVHSSYLTESNLVAAQEPRNFVRWNLFENFSNGAIATPLGSHQAFSVQDNGQQIYTVVTPDLPAASTHAASAIAVVAGNWFLHSRGQNWLVQAAFVVSQGGLQVPRDFVTGNTIVDLNSSSGIGVAVNSGMVGAYVANNTCWGVYNFSFCYGSEEGAAVGTLYSNNTAYDVDATSWAGETAMSSETYVGSSGSLFLQNNNDTTPPGGQLVWKNVTTVVGLSSSSFDAVNVTALIPSTGATWRTPLPTDFNVTSTNTYLPSSLYALANNFSAAYAGPWSTTTHANPSFFVLSGYAGLFTGQTYPIRPAWISGEVRLPLVWKNATVAWIPGPQTANGHLYTFQATAAGAYQISADSATAPPVALAFNGLVPGGNYVVTRINTTGTPSPWILSVTADQLGVATDSFLPATMPLNSTFSIACAAVCLPAPPAGGFWSGSFFGLPVPFWFFLAVVLVVVFVGSIAGRLEA